MPRKYKGTLGSRTYAAYSERCLEEALAAITSGSLTQRDAALKYKIPRSTLKSKLKGKHNRNAGGQTVFTSEQEEKFAQYTIAMSTFGFPIDTFDLRCIIKSYLDRKGRTVKKFKSNMPGKDWTDSFLKRHSELTVRLASNIKRKRAQVGVETIEEYFANLSNELSGVPPENVWNYDETNLTDDPGSRKIITKRGCKYPERMINSTKTATSLMFCGNAAGEVIPPYVVYKAESMWNTWTEHGPVGARYNRSKSGWFDSACFEDWFQSLLLPRIKRSSGKHVVIGDNLSSHINPVVLDLCVENNISFVALPPNSTHLTQPLDVAYFRPMKVAWKQILTNWKEKGKGRKSPSLPKDEFPKLLKLLVGKLDDNGNENMKSGFRKCGIFPVDKQQVLSRLPDQVANAMNLQEEVGESFLIYLKEARADGGSHSQRKRQKVTVVPGKSVSSAEVQPIPVIEGQRTKKKQSNDTTPQPSTSHAQSSDDLNNDDLVGTISPDVNNESDNCDTSDEERQLESHSSDDEVVARRKKVSVKGTLNVGDFVVVNYDDEMFPGQVKLTKKNGAEVSTMVRSGQNWKWPATEDQIFYFRDQIVDIIAEPVSVGTRGAFSVPEMSQY
jgi:hypothetical protein